MENQLPPRPYQNAPQVNQNRPNFSGVVNQGIPSQIPANQVQGQPQPQPQSSPQLENARGRLEEVSNRISSEQDENMPAIPKINSESQTTPMDEEFGIKDLKKSTLWLIVGSVIGIIGGLIVGIVLGNLGYWGYGFALGAAIGFGLGYLRERKR